MLSQHNYIVNGYGNRLPQTSEKTINFLSFLIKLIANFFHRVVRVHELKFVPYFYFENLRINNNI